MFPVPAVCELPGTASSRIAMERNNLSEHRHISGPIDIYRCMGPPAKCLHLDVGHRTVHVSDSRTRLAGYSNRPIDNFFCLRIPIKLLAAPVRLCGHDDHDRMGEAVIYIGVWLGSGLHGLEPIRHVNDAVISRTARVRRLRARDFYDFFLVNLWGHLWKTAYVYRPGILVPAPFLTDRKQGGAFAAVVRDGAVTTLDS